MASVNETRPHCVNQMGKTHSKSLAARHGNGMLCVNRPLVCIAVGSGVKGVVSFLIYAPTHNPTNHLAMLFTRTPAAMTKC